MIGFGRIRFAVRPHVWGAIGLCGLGSLAQSCVLPAPPERLWVDEAWSGVRDGSVIRFGYFTAEEIADPRWEEARLKKIGTNGCKDVNEIILKRDVRWYSSPGQSGQICGAVVYSLTCDSAAGGPDSEIARTRLEMLTMEPSQPVEKNCGSKDRSAVIASLPNKRPRVSQRLPSFRDAAPQQYQNPRLTSGEQAICTAGGGVPSTLVSNGREICLKLATDAGKACTDGSECETGTCNLDDVGDRFARPRLGTKAAGVCARSDYAAACRWPVVRGRVQALTCANPIHG